MKKFNLNQIRDYIANQSKQSKIYIGCDSTAYQRKGKWYADYYLVVVIHIDGCRGCKIFGEVVTEPDYCNDKKKPTYRLMKEVYKVSELFLKISDQIADRTVEIHLDLNPDLKYASSLVVQQAIGYIRGTCNVVPMVKPNAFAASYAADRLLRTR